jgi:hypothetical protein
MKKTFLALMLVLTFIFISCNNDDMETEVNPFIGTWENNAGDGLRFIFTKTYVTQTTIIGEILQFKGNYTYDDTHITITTDFREFPFDNLELYPNPFVYPYRFENNVMIIGAGSFIKASGS